MSKAIAPPLESAKRCRWARNDDLLAHYHDREWGMAIDTDDGHLERMALEIFQCGLSWRIVLVKRPALREAFHQFRVERVAAMCARDVDRLMATAAIIRNRRKIEATIENARRFIDIGGTHGAYVTWLASHSAAAPRHQKALMALLGKTFRFMGPETSKCYLWGCGVIPPKHERHCWRR